MMKKGKGYPEHEKILPRVLVIHLNKVFGVDVVCVVP